MPRLLNRETFIALRARRQAHQIANEILNPPVQVTAIPCRHCGSDVPIPPQELDTRVNCPKCGQPTILPANFTVEAEIFEDSRPEVESSVPAGLRWGSCIILGLMLGLAVVAAVLLIALPS